MLNQVALISETSQVSQSQLALASAAIQKQITRDVAPIWDLNATVDSFARLEDVPIGYWQIIIRDQIPDPAQGVHKNRDNGQPFALVQFSDDWALTTSHECIEMLVDPSGNRTVTSNSVMEGQGRVQYLVEACDPSEAATFGYTVNGILLSDFYTPRFFDPVRAPGVQYSYTGAITEPRQVLEGGYLSWFDPESRHIFQLFVRNGENSFNDIGVFPNGFDNLREFSDRNSIDARKKAETARKPQGLLLTAAITANNITSYDKSVRAQAESLRSQINALLNPKEPV
jgi:hypothetical protein